MDLVPPKPGELVLYDYAASPNCRKVRIVLAEKSLRYTRRAVDIAKGAHRSPEYLTINPHGKIPAIQHHRPELREDQRIVTVYDSTIINEYLEDAFPHQRLMPEQAHARAEARILEDWADNILIEPVGVLFAQFVFTSESRRNQARIDQARMRVVELLRRIEERLDDQRAYLLGDYSIVDVAMTPHLAYADQFGVPFREILPRVSEWYARLKNRPSFDA